MPDATLCQRFGTRVRALRWEGGWTQEALAHEVGMHRTYLGGIERGVRNPSLTNVERIARALGVSMSTLFEDVDAPS